MKISILPSLLVSILLLTGCSAVFDMMNVRGLESDLSALLRERNVHVQLSSCKMIKGSRTGYCFTSAGEEDLQALISAFNLQVEDLAKMTPLTYEEGCGRAMQATRLYASRGNRPETLRLGPGKAFDFLYVSIGTPGTRSCIQTSASFG